MSDNKIEAEVRLDHKSVDIGVTSIVGQLGRLDKSVETSSSKLDNDMRRSLTSLGGVVRTLNFNTLVSQMNSLGGHDMFGGLAKSGRDAFSDLIKTGAGFQSQFNKVQVIGNFDTSEAERVQEVFRTLGRDLGLAVTPMETTAAAYELLSAGFTKSADATKILTVGLKLAKAGNADTAQTVKLLTQTLNSFGLEAKDAKTLGDEFFQMVKVGAVEIPELAAGMGRVTAAAKAAGVSEKELFSVIAVATTKGVPFTSAIDGMGGVLAALQKPTQDATKELQAMGIQIDAATLKQDGLAKTFDKLGNAYKKRGNDLSLSKIFGAEVPRNLVASVFEGGDFSSFSKGLDGIKNSAGELDGAVRTMSKGAEESFKRTKAAAVTLATGLEQQLDPALAKMADIATGAINALDRLPPSAKTFGLAVAGIATALVSVGTFALVAVGGILTIISQLSNLGIKLPKIGGGFSQLSRDVAIFNKENAAIRATQTGVESGMRGVIGTTGLLSAALVTGAALVLGYGAAWIKAQDDIATANLELQQADRGVSDLFGEGIGDHVNKEIRTQEALSIDSKDLADMGFTGGDLRFQLAQNRNQINTLEQKAGTASSLAEAQELKAKADYLRSTLDELSNKANALDAEVSTRARNASPEAKQAREKADDEEYADKLRVIELSKAGHAEKINQLNFLLDRHKLDAQKRDSLERKIAQEREASERSLADLEKKNADKVFKSQLQQVEHSKAGTEQKIADLQKLAVQYKKDFDRRLTIEDQIRAHEKDLQQQRESDVQKLADIKQQAADDEVSRSSSRQAELNRLQGRGVDTFGAQADELAAQGKAKTDKLDANLEKDLAKEKNPEVRRKLKEQHKKQTADVVSEFDTQGAELLRQDKQQRLTDDQQLMQGEQRSATTRIGILQKMLAAGKDVQSKLKAEVEARLALQEREIQLQAELAKAQTDDPRRVAQAEQEAQAQILAARQAATEEIHNGTKALQEQKKAKDAMNGKSEFSGNILTLDQFIQGEKDRFYGGDKATGPSPKPIPSINVRQAEDQIKAARTRTPGELSGSGVQVVQTNGRFEIILLNQDGKQVPYEIKRAQINGKDSETAKSRGTTRGGL